MAGRPRPDRAAGPRVRRAGTALTAAVLLGVVSCVSGCSSSNPEPSPTPTPPPSPTVEQLPGRSQSLDLDVGEKAYIDLGEVNIGVGDTWGAAGDFDQEVVSTEVIHENCGDAPGSPCIGPNSFVVEGLSPGRTTVNLQYCFRSAIELGCPGELEPDAKTREPIVLEVTVR